MTKLITSHIVNGNDLRLLALPEVDDQNEDKNTELKTEVRQVSSEVRNLLKTLPVSEIKKLQDKYGKFENSNE